MSRRSKRELSSELQISASELSSFSEVKGKDRHLAVGFGTIRGGGAVTQDLLPLSRAKVGSEERSNKCQAVTHYPSHREFTKGALGGEL